MERKYKYLGMVNIGNIICSIIRYSMGSSIVFMTHSTDQETVLLGSCSNFNFDDKFQNQTEDLIYQNCSTYEWTEIQQGYILGSYYYGYFIASIFINSILNFFSPQLLIFLSLFIPGLLNLGVKQSADCSIYILCGLRLLQGLFQGWIFPAETIIWGKHCDRNEQTFFSGLAMSSMYFGIVISALLTPIIIMATNWIFFFDLVGLLAIVWSLVWYFMFYWKVVDRQFGKPDLSEKLSTLPVLKSKQFWISSMGQIIMSALVILLTGSIPKFLFQVYNSPSGSLPALSFLAFTIAASMSSLFYQSIDMFITKLTCSNQKFMDNNGIAETDRSENQTRRLLGFISLFPSGILIGALFFNKCNIHIISSLMIFSTGFVGIAVSVFVPSFLDLSVKYAGRMHGLTNIWTAVAGFVIPYLIGLTVSDAPDEEASWKYIWLFFGIVSVLYSLSFLLFSKNELIVETNYDEEDEWHDSEITKLLNNSDMNNN